MTAPAREQSDFLIAVPFPVVLRLSTIAKRVHDHCFEEHTAVAGFRNVISTLTPNGEEITGRSPVVGQSINQTMQVTPLEQVNERIHDTSELWRHE